MAFVFYQLYFALVLFVLSSLEVNPNFKSLVFASTNTVDFIKFAFFDINFLVEFEQRKFE